MAIHNRQSTDQTEAAIPKDLGWTRHYVEYATSIFQSYKHLPDRWRKKCDANGDDTLDLQEFTASLEQLDWWNFSRKSVEEWVKWGDKNNSGQLEQDEAKAVIGSAHGKFDQVFEKLDRDKSGGISVSELTPYLEAIIAGTNKKRNK